MVRLNNPTLTDSDAIPSQPRRSELISKEVQWQQRQESLEKRICELGDSLEKGQKSNSSQRKPPNADKEKKTTVMYTNYSSVNQSSVHWLYCTTYS